MEFFGLGKSTDISDCDVQDFFGGEFLNDTFNRGSTDYYNDDLFKMLFEDPILNDKMITEAVAPHIQSEHSYSISDQIIDPVSDVKVECFPDIDSDFFPSNVALDLSQKSMESSIIHNSRETSILPSKLDCKTPTPTTIIITTPSEASMFNKSAQTLLPRSHIKMEPVDIDIDGIYPLTPPGSSSSSDSDGGNSPRHRNTSSPIDIGSLSPSSSHHMSVSKQYVQPMFTNPIPTSGTLMLTEEEKRTLVQEGYPVPHKLPLTKSEEKNLKKIRRKIKNKISAQESRRKKKEYLELLEKQVESYTHENTDLKRRIDSLESNNKSLLGQLHSLQLLLSKYAGGGLNSSSSGSRLMVVVLCFALFLGSWAPTSLNVGYNLRSSSALAGMSHPISVYPSPYLGPSIKKANIDPYVTPHVKSRVLLSVNEACQDEEAYGPRMPLLMQEMCMGLEKESTFDAEEVREAVNYPVLKTSDGYLEGVIEESVPGQNITRALMFPDINLTSLINVTLVQ